MSGSKHEVGILEETVEEFDELAHDGTEGDEVGFVFGLGEAAIEGGKDGVMLGGGKSGHVEDLAGMSATAADMALARARPAFVGVRNDAQEVAGLPRAQ